MSYSKKPMTRFIGNQVNKALSLVGLHLQIQKSSNSNNQKLKMKNDVLLWKKAALLPKVKTLIDVGVGPKGTKALYAHFPEARYIFIDPLLECRDAVFEYLDGGKHIFIKSAIGSEGGVAKINIARKISRSSMLIRKHHYLSEAIAFREVTQQRLDDALKDIKLEEPYGLKIDTEGFELEVLKGAASTLSRSLFVIVEFHFKDARRCDYTLQDLIDYLKNAGFSAFTMLRDGRNIIFVSENISAK